MAGDVVQRSSGKSSGRKGRRPKRRVNIKLDMTPMVDIAFLLLIFYMVSTVFAMPQAMEINLPPATDVIIKESNLLTVWVDRKGQFWHSVGKPGPSNLPELLTPEIESGSADSEQYVLCADSLREMLMFENRANPKLSTVLKLHPEANYRSFVDILDEIEMIERQWNVWLANDLAKEVKELTRDDGKFSYRYAVGEWEERDSKIIRDANKKIRKDDTDDL